MGGSKGEKFAERHNCLPWWKRPPPDFQAVECRHQLYSLLLCAITERNEGGEQAASCQVIRQDLEKLCAKYRSSWNEWSAELMDRHCIHELKSYKRCVAARRQLGKKGCPVSREWLEAACPAMRKEIAKVVI